MSGAILRSGLAAVAAGLCLFSSGAATVSAADADTPTRLYMPDGQLVSHSIRVYVSRDIPASAQPRLRLLGSNAITEPAPSEANTWEPRLIAPGQEWVQPGEADGADTLARGTLLLFDLKKLDFKFKAMRRVMPVLVWTEDGVSRMAVGTREVNVGNTVWAPVWTAIIVGAALLIILLLARAHGDDPRLLLTGVDGHLSLAQTQIACWTIAVGTVVLGYGLVRLAIPEIPESLLVLMGTSLVTGGLAFFQDGQKERAAGAATAATVVTTGKRPWHLPDLVRVFAPGKPPELSLAKAQMLFWTLLLIVLFVTKSVLDGAIWNVPWPLVALMGFSQAGYLAPKLAAAQ